MTDPTAAAFATLEMEDFPIVIDFIRNETIIHTIRIASPGVINIPSIRADLVRIDFGNGKHIIERDMTK